MSFSDFIRVESFQCHGLERSLVTIEVLRSRGLSQISLTGLPDAWLRDSRDKIRALVGRYVEWGPLDRVLVHLLPADESKNGAHLELPIVLACMAVLARDKLPKRAQKFLKEFRFVGSLSLEGGIFSTSLSDALQASDPKKIIGPRNFRSLHELWNFICTGTSFDLPVLEVSVLNFSPAAKRAPVVGRYWERFWLLVAAVAQSPVFLMGPPGAGKTYLAHWAYALLPPAEPELLFVMQQLRTLSGLDGTGSRPLLNPHSRTHLSEFLGVQRKGAARPGLFSQAHGGLLILDEFSEMNRDCREILRTILDQKQILQQTKNGSLRWPSDFWLIATSNPCPCGMSRGRSYGHCRCGQVTRVNYRNRLSGPLLDRIGLKIFMDAESTDHLVPDFIDRSILDHSADELGELVRIKRLELKSHLARAMALFAGSKYLPCLSNREHKMKSKLLAALLSLTDGIDRECLAMLELMIILEQDNDLGSGEKLLFETTTENHAQA